MDYPVWDVAMGGSVLMAVVAITHVIVSHFAVGGGLLIAVTETLAVRRGDSAFRDLARRSSLVLILVSTVFGAISGVGDLGRGRPHLARGHRRAHPQLRLGLGHRVGLLHRRARRGAALLRDLGQDHEAAHLH